MTDRYFYNADGELLLVPQHGRLRLVTELGILEVDNGEIALLPRGLRFRVELPDGPSRGYICENYGALFRLPELGPIGANGLANSRDFLAPVAAFEDKDAALQVDRQVPGQPVGRGDGPLAARRGRLARQLRALQIRSAHASRRSARSASIIPIRRSSRC